MLLRLSWTVGGSDCHQEGHCDNCKWSSLLFPKLWLKQTHLETKDEPANGKGISACSILNEIQRAFFYIYIYIYYGHHSHLPHGVPRSLKNNKRQTINTEFGEQARPPGEASNCVFAQSEVSIHLVTQASSTGDTLDGYSDSSFSGVANRSAPGQSPRSVH